MNGFVKPVLLLALAPATLAAQASKYTRPPVLPVAAALTVPTVRSSALPNGVQLRVVEQHELPLVQVTLNVAGGSRLDGQTPGITTFMAGMLDEGAGSRDALGLQSELAYLGASLSTTADWDRISVSLKVPVRALPAALALMADVVMRPTFPAEEVRRQRDLRLTGLLQARDQPGTIAGLAFNQVLFPATHPYARNALGDSATVAAYDSATVRRFYESAMRPDRASLFIVGDVNEAQVRTLMAQHLGSWRATGTPIALPTAPAAVSAPATTRVWLVDKPNAAQSVIIIGWPGVERTSPDYAALQVMNTLLGGSFTSRLNDNLREQHGYAYGARSGFRRNLTGGLFQVATDVQTDKSGPAVGEVFKELERILTPAAADEVERARNYAALGYAGDFETTGQLAQRMVDAVVYGLADGFYEGFVPKALAVDAAALQQAARGAIDTKKLALVVVGDRAKVEAPLRALNLGEIKNLTVDEVMGKAPAIE